MRTYSFVSQIVAFTDPGARARLRLLPGARRSYLRDAGTVERLDLGTEVELTHLRHQMTFSGSARADVRGRARSGRSSARGKGGQQELELEHLSSIVEILNERFGTDLTDVDKLLFDQFEESWVADDELSDQAQNNSLDNFRLVFDRKFLQTIITRMDANDEIFKKILDDEDFRARLRVTTCARSMTVSGRPRRPRWRGGTGRGDGDSLDLDWSGNRVAVCDERFDVELDGLADHPQRLLAGLRLARAAGEGGRTC